METKELSSDKGKPIIFISHSSKDGDVANMLAKFLCATDIPRDNVFCTSLTGNGVKRRISDEVKAALKASVFNIVILSRNYYQSAYCLSEAGVIWYRDDVPFMLVALPEINEKNIYSFLDKNDMLRRLDFNKDILDIYEEACKAVGVPCRGLSAITEESAELMKQYADFLKSRPTSKTEPVVSSPDDTASKAVSTSYRRISVTALKSAKPMKRYSDSRKTREVTKTEPAVLSPDDTASNAASAVSGNQNTEMKHLTLQDAIASGCITDDECVILYYLLEKRVRKASKQDITDWMFENEIYGVSVDNAFDMLITTFDCIIFSGYKLELEIKTFKELILNKTLMLPICGESVNKYKKLASDIFKHLWRSGKLYGDGLVLFIAYIIDKKACSFTRGFPNGGDIESIKRWQRNNDLDSTLSDEYENQLTFFIENGLVYKSSSGGHFSTFSSYTYTIYNLYPSLRELLFNNSEPYQDFLNECKQSHRRNSRQGHRRGLFNQLPKR